MPIVIFSRLPFTSSEAIAHNAASRLGFECLDQEVFQEAAQRSGFSEAHLRRAFEEAPSLFGMSLATRKRAVAHVGAALSRRLLRDNVVYHGPFGHFLIQGVAHVLKVRIHAQLADRVALKVKRDGGSTQEAEKFISRIDRERLLLARMVFGAEDDDPNLFDLVVNTSQVDPETAVGIIAETVQHKRYQAMTYSQRCLENLELSYRARAALVELDPDVAVQAENGQVRVRTKASGRSKEGRVAAIRERIGKLEGVRTVEVEVVEDFLDRLAGSLR
jgi:cytidylate kinase